MEGEVDSIDFDSLRFTPALINESSRGTEARKSITRARIGNAAHNQTPQQLFDSGGMRAWENIPPPIKLDNIQQQQQQPSSLSLSLSLSLCASPHFSLLLPLLLLLPGKPPSSTLGGEMYVYLLYIYIYIFI